MGGKPVVWGWDERIGEEPMIWGWDERTGEKSMVCGWDERNPRPTLCTAPKTLAELMLPAELLLSFLLGLRDCKTTSSIVGTRELARHKNDCSCCCCCCFCVCCMCASYQVNGCWCHVSSLFFFLLLLLLIPLPLHLLLGRPDITVMVDWA